MPIDKIKLPDNSTQDIHDKRVSGIDSAPTSGSGNLVTSGGVKSALDGKMNIGGVISDFNTETTPGNYAIDYTVSANRPSINYGQALVLNAATDTVAQLAFNYNSGSAYFRGGSGWGATWNSWREFAFKDDLSTALSGYLPLTGGTMTNTNLVTNLNADLLDGLQPSQLDVNTAKTLKGYDNRGVDNPPSWYMSNPGQISIFTEFAQAGGAVGSHNFESRTTFTPWGDASGGRPTQLSLSDSGAFFRTSASDSAWNNWKQIAFTDSDNLTNYLFSKQVSVPQDATYGSSNVAWAEQYAEDKKKAFVYNDYGVEYSYLFGLNSSGTYGAILKMGYADPYLRILRKENNTWKTSDWEKINAGEADKLSTARTIWGQSFDGTGDVNGILSATAGLFGGANGVNIGATYAGSPSGAYDLIERAQQNGTLFFQYNHAGSISMCQGGGNVGIGTTSPASKLTVAGTIRSENQSDGFPSFRTNGDNSYTAFASFLGGSRKWQMDTINDGSMRLYLDSAGKYLLSMWPSGTVEIDGGITTTLQTSEPSGGMLPNREYQLGTLSGNTTFTLASGTSGVTNHYFWSFDTGSTAPTITWPSGIASWYGGSAPTINASKHYEVSVLNGVAVVMEV